MGRALSTTFCVALLAAAAAAFALTEGAKTELSPVYGTKIDKVFSPTCNRHVCARRVARIDFKLRRRARLQVWVVAQGSGRRVATLVAGRSYRRGTVRIAFDGRAPSGTLLPDGTYVPVVRLVGDITLTLPNPIRLDTVAPRVLRARLETPLVAPDDPRRPHAARVTYRFSGSGHAVLFADGHRVAVTYRQRTPGTVSWYGTVGGLAAPAGPYRLELAVQDAAGNRSAPVAVGTVLVRYLVLSRASVQVARRGLVRIHVVIGPAHVRFSFVGRSATTTARTLLLRAPRKRGHYRLVVHGDGHVATVLVVVG